MQISMEIIQIAVSDCIVFGLGDDSQVYRWDHVSGSWDVYAHDEA